MTVADRNAETLARLQHYEQIREEQRAVSDAIRQHGLRMESHFSSGALRWFIFAGDFVLGQYNHRALAALHLITEQHA